VPVAANVSDPVSWVLTVSLAVSVEPEDAEVVTPAAGAARLSPPEAVWVEVSDAPEFQV
jgi:hypothetical protein